MKTLLTLVLTLFFFGNANVVKAGLGPLGLILAGTIDEGVRENAKDKRTPEQKRAVEKLVTARESCMNVSGKRMIGSLNRNYHYLFSCEIASEMGAFSDTLLKEIKEAEFGWDPSHNPGYIDRFVAVVVLEQLELIDVKSNKFFNEWNPVPEGDQKRFREDIRQEITERIDLIELECFNSKSDQCRL